MAPLGIHCLLDLYDCPVTKLDDPKFVVETLRRAAALSGSTLLSEVSHRFHPQGVTALGLLAESHISIHTWPENSYAAADIFTCGETTSPEKACEFLVDAFEARRHRLTRLERGCEHARPDAAGATAVAAARDENPVPDESVPCPDPRFARISG